MKSKVIAGGVLSALLLGSVAGFSIISAQATSNGQNKVQEYNQKLADKLSINYDTLCEAKKSVQIDLVDERVTAGTLDSTRAEELKTEINESECGAAQGLNGHRMKGPDLDLVAEKLGMTVEEIQAAREEGKTIQDLATEKGITLDDIMPGRGMMNEKVAEVLGMTVEELQAAKDAGKTIQDLATEKGISLEEVLPERGGMHGMGGGIDFDI